MNCKINKYIGKKQALDVLGISSMTLLKLVEHRKIEIIKTVGGHRKYNVQKYIEDNKKESEPINSLKEINNKEKVNICYVRVSSNGQKDDLERQKAKLKELYPEYHLIEDIGSGINFKKRGLLKIIEYAIAGKIKELVIVHKDRLLRFGYELIEHLIERYSKGKITIINKNIEMEPEEEMVKDVLQIMNVFVAKMNGRRKYTKNK